MSTQERPHAGYSLLSIRCVADLPAFFPLFLFLVFAYRECVRTSYAFVRAQLNFFGPHVHASTSTLICYMRQKHVPPNLLLRP